ncbi:hypothetical protein F5Y18DRAFT_375867 [Xylariaceae sp. FL1019]|nr:hypothetical protein F5Y18DRAFT_375867 [Xylariaceae sp. FL1019]
MSGNRSDSSSLPDIYRTADGIIQSILDNNATPAEISPSGELLRAIERFHSLRPPSAAPSSSPRRELIRNHLHRWTARSAAQTTMPDENPGIQPRSFSRTSRPSNTPAPTLPSLRSLNTRPLPPINTPGISARARRIERASPHDMDLLDWNGNGEDAIDSWDRDFDAEEHRDTHDVRDVRRLGLMPIGHSRSPFNDSASDRPDMDLLGFHPTPPHQFTDLFSPGTQEPEGSRRKRRKIDSDRLCPNFQGFSYGKFGQVQPGQLRMELVTYDGGIFNTTYAAENILKNDSSVYCTEDSRCNILLRHQGATVFTLKELIIKAPKCNFDSPVQAGMVFVSMTCDHLLNRTAQYQIQYAPPRSSSRSMEREAPPVVSIRHGEDGTTMTRAQVRARRLYNIGMDDEDNEVGVAQIPSEFNASQPHFQVTNERSDDEEDGTNDDRGGRTSHLSESDSSEDTLNDFSMAMGTATHRLRRRRRRINAANAALSEAAEAAQFATQEAVRAVGGELMKPSARFHIEHNKSKCTIRFDPPVSGRFILLKMWNPRRHANENIDIQAVICKGYAGPRFCPSIELR